MSADIVQRRFFVSPKLMLLGGAIFVGSAGYLLWPKSNGPSGLEDAPAAKTSVPMVSWTPPPPPAEVPASPQPAALPSLPPLPPPPPETSAQPTSPASLEYVPVVGPFIRHSASQVTEIAARQSVGGMVMPPPPAPPDGSAQQVRGPVHSSAVQVQEAGVVGDLSRTLKPTDRVFCTLLTAIDTTHPGKFACIASRDVLSWDRSTVLIPKDTPIDGDYQTVGQGQGRMTAVAGAAWRSDGLVVPLGDPITDDLGRAGIPGVYDNSRMWKGIGTALLFDAATAAVQLPQAALLSRTGGNTYLNFNATQNAVQAALSQLVTQPPIIFKNQGEEIGILITKPVHAGAIHYEVVR